VKAFMEFYLANAPTLVRDVQYIPNPPAKYEADRARLDEFARA
jgi:hypothetical protein